MTKIAIKHSRSKPVVSIQMTVDQWISIQRNPHQRCERLRVNKAHLKELEFSHWSVEMAVLPDGQLFKLNGHTRAYMWLKELSERPPYVNATVISVNSIDDVKRLYEHYDSTTSVKLSPDVVQSAFHAHDITPQTRWIKEGKIASMLNDACETAKVNKRNISLMGRVGLFKDEIVLFDSLIDVRKSMFPIGFGAGALIALRLYGSKVLPFLQSFNDQMGRDDYGRKDSVKTLLEYLAEKKAAKQMAGKENNKEQQAFTLACIDRYLKGDKLSVKRPTLVDLSSLMKPVALMDSIPSKASRVKSTGISARA